MALDKGLGVILCCGETLEQREAKQTVDVVTKQLQAVADVVKDWSKIFSRSSSHYSIDVAQQIASCNTSRSEDVLFRSAHTAVAFGNRGPRT